MTRNNEIFSNYYRVMEILYDNQVTINDVTFTPMTQEDISKSIKCDRTTITPIIKKLKENGMIVKNTNRGQYQLTSEAIRIIRAIKRI